MKFCPYCGSEMRDEVAAFCMECGKPIPEKAKQAETKNKETFKKKRRPQKEKDTQKKKHPLNPDEQETPVDDGYDGYYNDVLPEDFNTEIRTMDKQLLKKVIALGVGALMIIVACVAIMYMLG